MANINKIQLPNGTQYDIEDAVARGKSVMVVTITGEEDAQSGDVNYSADKTFAEISAHIQNGGYVVAKNDYNGLFNLAYFDDYEISFSGVDIHVDHSLLMAAQMFQFIITNIDEVMYAKNVVRDSITIVNIQKENNELVADKSYNEIVEDLNNKKYVICALDPTVTTLWDWYVTYLPFERSYGGSLVFRALSSYMVGRQDSAAHLGIVEAHISSNNTVAIDLNTANIPQPSSTAPLADGTAAVGTSTDYARADHVHPVGSLSGLSDTTVTTPSNGQVLTYDSTTQKWVNGAAASGSVQSDWDENDSTDPAYILNRPAIRAGEGENSIIEGQIEVSSGYKEYKLYITGDANATTFTYTTEEESLPSNPTAVGYMAYYNDALATPSKWQRIKSLDQTGHTITLYNRLSTSAISNAELLIIFMANGAIGSHSHKEGARSVAAGNASHAEGRDTLAAGNTSHAEGSNTSANGHYSHAEGYCTIAIGANSHAEGYNTIAYGVGTSGQHTEGKYNIEDPNNTYAHIVGNGTSSARSNAHTLDWSGNGWYSGKVSAGTVATPATVTNANDLTTKAYVDGAISSNNNVFLVNFENDHYDSTNSVYVLTADKTLAEVIAAYNAGKLVEGFYYGRTYDLQVWGETFVNFNCPVVVDDGGGGLLVTQRSQITWELEYNESTDDYDIESITYQSIDISAPKVAPGSSLFSNGQILQYNSTSGLWEAANLPSIPTASTSLPIVDGTAAIGSSSAYAKADHVHPTDTSRAPVNSPALTGTPTAPTAAAGTNTTQIATTQFVNSAVSSALTSVMTYKGTKATVAALPSSGNAVGDVWHVTANGSEYAWDGSTWQELGTSDKEVMVVYPTNQDGQGIYTFNKTFSEIYSHLSNGGIAILRYTSSGDTYIYDVKKWDSSYIGFAYSVIYKVPGEEEYDYEVWFEESMFIIYSNNTGEYLGGTNAVISSGANLNGNYTSFPTFYAPTSAGTSGYVLTSSGSGAPTWQQPTAVPSASSTTPLADGTAAVGSSTAYARADHVHPSDSTKANVTDVLTKTNTTAFTPTADYHPATKAYVDAAVSGSNDVMVVTITEEEDQQTGDLTYSANKTPVEIYNHISNGGIAICDYYGDIASCKTYYYSEGEYYIEFNNSSSYTDSDGNIVITGRIIRINRQNDSDTIRIDDENSYIPQGASLIDGLPLADGTASRGSSLSFARADHVHPKITQTLSMSSNVITLTGSDGTTSSVTLPVYNGSVSVVTGGGS